MYYCGPLHMDEQKQEDQLEPTYSSYVPTQDVALKTRRKQWMIGRVAREGQGYLCWWRDMMMMMMMLPVISVMKDNPQRLQRRDSTKDENWSYHNSTGTERMPKKVFGDLRRLFVPWSPTTITRNLTWPREIRNNDGRNTGEKNIQIEKKKSIN